jgi:hypothetical protein
MSLRTTILASLRKQWRTARDAGARKIVTHIAEKLGAFTVKMVAFLALAGIASLITAHLPTTWQSRVVVALSTLGVPDKLLPSDPQGKFAAITLGPANFGYANLLFANAEQESAAVLQFDRQALSNVVICHPWKGAGATNLELLQSFVRNHPACFDSITRNGGGIELRAKSGASAKGDFVLSVDGKVRAFACECRGLLDQVQRGLASGC